MPLYIKCNIAKIDFVGLFFKLCLMAFIYVDMAEALTHSYSNNLHTVNMKAHLSNNHIEGIDSKYSQSSHVVPFRMDPFLQSLKELQLQENHNVRKKKSVKRLEKKIHANEMRDRIKDLMSNISRTLDDVDWYFTYEQLDSEKNKVKDYFVSEATQKLVIKRMKEVDDDTSDVFVDSFVRQMYDIDPSILDKINDRIDSEFAGEAELSEGVGDPLSVKRPARLASTARTRKARVSTAIMRDDYSYVDDLAGDMMLTEIAPNYLKGVNRMFKHENVAKLLGEEPNLRETTTTTVETTTFENFYDYADYYRENEEDKLRDVAHYEIVQDVLHSTQQGVVEREFATVSYKTQIKNKHKKPRHFHKNKDILKKRLKDRLENFESKKPYKEYNIDSDY